MKAMHWTGLVLLTTCALARGDEAQGREACLRFLTKGEYAPRPTLTTLEEAQAHPGHGHPAQGELTELVGRAFTVAYDEHHAVVSYNAFDKAMRLEDSQLFNEPERARAEVARRTRFSERELQRRAKAFYASRIPGRERRLFERSDATLLCTFNPIWYQVTFSELATDGALAVYPNTITVGLNPETGEVVFYRATHVRARWTEATPVDADAAYAAARALDPALSWGEPVRSLAYVRDAVRPVWQVAGDDGKRIVILQVDAVSAEAGVVAVIPME